MDRAVRATEPDFDVEVARISQLHGVAFGWHGCLLRHLALPRGLTLSQQRQGSLVVQDGAPNLIQLRWIHADCAVVSANYRNPEIRVFAVVDDGRGGSDGDFVQQHSARWLAVLPSTDDLSSGRIATPHESTGDDSLRLWLGWVRNRDYTTSDGTE